MMRAVTRTILAVAVPLAIATPDAAFAGRVTAVTPGRISADATLNISATGMDASAANNRVTFTPQSGAPVDVVATNVGTVDAAAGVRRIGVRVPRGFAAGTVALRVTNLATGEITEAGTVQLVVLEVLPAALTQGTGPADIVIRSSPNGQFAATGTRAVFGTGVTVHSTRVDSPTQVTVSITVSSTAPLGFRSVATISSNQTAFAPDGFEVRSPDPGPTNQPPTVQITAVAPVTLPAGTTLSATVTDDNLPNPPGAVQLAWSQVSGPSGGTATFAAGNAATTGVTFSTAGTYVLRLTANDSALSGQADVTVVVNPAPPQNTTPTVQITAVAPVTLPAGTTLSATVTDDNLPNPPGAVTLTWSQVSGPSGGTATFAAGNAASTGVTFSTAGTYVLRLTANDSALSGFGDVTVAVNAAEPTNTPPVITSTAPTTATVGQPYAYTATATDADNDPVTFHLLSGPTGFAMAPNGVVSWTPTADQVGAQAVTIEARDGRGGNTPQQFSVTVNAAEPTNTPPVITSTAPTTATVGQPYAYTATATDADNDPVTFFLVSGPTGFAIAPGGAVAWTPTANQVGAQTVTIEARDGRGGNTPQSFLVTVGEQPPTNAAPTVTAGPAQTVTLPAEAALAGSVIDDGLPPGAPLTIEWSKVDGPGAVAFANAASATSSASFTQAGVYTLRLTASDTEFTRSADVVITVNAAPPTNAAPTVDAGPAQTITLPAAALLAGVVTDDGLPQGATLTVAWTKVEGPGTVTFAAAAAAATSATFSGPGTYTLRLTASDTQFSPFDDVVITVNAPSPTNAAPSVTAGPDATGEVGVPIDLAGAVTDDNRVSATPALAWRLLSGPGAASFANAAAAQTTVTVDAPGVYVLQLSADDGEFVSADEVAVTVTASSTSVADRAPPIVALIAPREALPGAEVELRVETSDNVGVAGVRFEVQDQDGSDVTAAPYTRRFTVPLVASPGTTIALKATARDAAGNEAHDNATITISATPDTELPAVQISGPASTAPGAALRVTATASDNVGVAEVRFLVDGVAIGASPAEPYVASHLVPADATAGSSLTIIARARDHAGNEAESVLQVSVQATPDAEPPTITLDVPQETFPGALLPVGATASDAGGIASVGFTVDEAQLATVLAPPYTASYRVPAAQQPGTSIAIVATATDFANLTATATAAVRVVAPPLVTQGVVTGEAYDDATGLPLAGVRVEIEGVDAAGVPFASETLTDARGRYLLRGNAGEARVRLTRDGYTRVDRRVTIAGAQAVTAFDARLTPTDAPAGRVVLTSLAGGQPAGVRLVPVSGQGLQGLLPLGWSPVGAADVWPHTASIGPSTLRVSNALGIAGGTPLVVVRFDEAAGAWRAVGGGAFAGNGQWLETTVSATGQYAFLVADTVPAAPPAAVAGQLLGGVDQASLPADLVTAISPEPRILFYEPGVFSEVAGLVTSATPMTSGLPLLARITESYRFVSGDELLPEPYEADLVFYQVRGAAATGDAQVTARFVASPSQAFESLSLERGVITVELIADGAGAAPRGLVTSGGGVVDGPGGLQLVVPAGAVSDPTPLALAAIPASPVPLPAALAFVAGASLQADRALARGGLLSLPAPAGLTDVSRLLLVRVAAIGGQTRLLLSGVVRLEGGRLVADTRVAGQATALEGVVEPGQYLLVDVDGPIGFVGGLVRGVEGASFAGALVTSDSLSIVSRSNALGAYLAVGRVGNATFTARDLTKNDTGGAQAFVLTSQVQALALRLVAVPPRVTSITPADGAGGVALGTPVVVTFSEPIDPASVSGANLANVLLRTAAGDPVVGSASLSVNNTTLTFRPSQALAPDAGYTFQVTTGVRDLAGYALASAVSVSFETLDTTPPPTPAAGSITAGVPNAEGQVRVSASQGTAGPRDRVFVDNVTKGTSAVALVDANGSFSTVIVAGLTDKLRVRIVDESGNETVQELAEFKQVNADGSVSQVVSPEGGVIEGPAGLRATIRAGTFPGGAVVTLNTVPLSAIPITFTAEQADLFEQQAAFSLDFGGATPSDYIDVSVPAGPGDSAADQWIVARVTELTTGPLFEIADTARFRDGRITTSSPPCPGVAAAGVYGITKAKQTYGLNFAQMYGGGRYRLRAEFNLFGLGGPLLIPFHALSAELPGPVCFPVISGRVTIVPNTVRITVAPEQLTPTDRQVLVTNVSRGGSVAYPRTVRDFEFDSEWLREGDFSLAPGRFRTVAKGPGELTQRVPLYVDTINGVRRFVVRAADVAVPVRAIEITDLAKQRTFTHQPDAVPFEVSVNGGVSDTFEVRAVPIPALTLQSADVPPPYLERRVVPHTKRPSAFGEGNLVLKALPGTFDPTEAEFPPGAPGAPRTGLFLGNQNGLLPIPDEAVVEGGIPGFAFTGDPTLEYRMTVTYRERPSFLITIPRARLVVVNTNTGDVVEERVLPVPPRDEPVQIDAIIDDSVPPVVVSGPSRVDNFDPTSLLTFRFSEPMDAESLKRNFVILDRNGKQVAGDVRVTQQNRVATFVPLGGLKLGERYTVLLKGTTGDVPDAGGGDLIRDVAGRALRQVRLEVSTFRPRPLATFAGASPFKDVAIRRIRVDDTLRTRLFVTAGGQSANLVVLDATDPFGVTQLGSDTTNPSRQRVAVLPDARFSFGPERGQLFSGDLVVTTAFNTSRSFLTFVDATNPAAPVQLGPKVLTRVPEDFVPGAGFPVVYENAYAKGIALVQTADREVYAYAAVERVGLMLADVGNNLPQQKLETLYPGDITDVIGYDNVLFAIDKTFGNPRLLSLGVSLNEMAPPARLAATPRRLRLGTGVLTDLDGDGRVEADEVVDLVLVGTDRDVSVFKVRDSSGRVGDPQNPAGPQLLTRVPTRGVVRDVEVDPTRIRAMAIVDEGSLPYLYMIDLTRLDSSVSDGALIDSDGDGTDDRIIFRHPFPNGVNGMRLDLDRGLLYVANPSGLEIWQVYDNCCDLGVDVLQSTQRIDQRPSGRSNDVFKRELDAIRKGIVLGLDRAREKCGNQFDVTKMRLIESGSSACLWTEDPEKACGNNYQPGLSDHDISTFMPDEWYEDASRVPDPDFPPDFTGPPTLVSLAACVVSALHFPFVDPHTHEPKEVEGTGFTFNDLSFIPNFVDDFYSGVYRLDRTIPGIAGDTDNDLGLGRQLLIAKHLTEAYGVNLRGTPGVAVNPAYLGVDVSEAEFERLFKQYRRQTKIPQLEGYEWAMLMEFLAFKLKLPLRIQGASFEGSMFHALHVKQVHSVGKVGIRAALARIVANERARDIFLNVRRGDPPPDEVVDPEDASVLVLRRNACYVYRADQRPREWSATRGCGSLEEYIASTAVRTFKELPVTERPLTEAEVDDVVTFYRVKADLERVTTDAEADQLVARVMQFIRKVKRDTREIYDQQVAADPRRAKRDENRLYAERRLGEVKESKLHVVPHVYNRSFRNAPGVKLRMYHREPGGSGAVPFCGSPALPDCAFTLSVSGGEHVKPAWRRKGDGVLLIDEESKLAVPIFAIKVKFGEHLNQVGHVAFTIDVPERTVAEADRENNVGGFHYYVLDTETGVPVGPLYPPDVPSPVSAADLAPDPACLAAPALQITQWMTVADDLAADPEKFASPMLLYLGQQATLHVEVSNPTPAPAGDTEVCTTLTNDCYGAGTVPPGGKKVVSVPFQSYKPVVVQAVTSAYSPDVGITTASPYNLSVNCEPLIVFYDPDPNALGDDPAFSVMRGGAAVRYAKAISPFTGRPAFGQALSLRHGNAVHGFVSLRPNGGFGGDKEGMRIPVPHDTPFGTYPVSIESVNGGPISCGVPIDFRFSVRNFEYTHTLGAGASAEFGGKIGIGGTVGFGTGLQFTFKVRRDNVRAPGDDPVTVVDKELRNIIGLEFEPRLDAGVKFKKGLALFEASGSVSGLFDAKAEVGKAEATAALNYGVANRLEFGGFTALTTPSPGGGVPDEVKELGSAIAFSLFSAGSAYEVKVLTDALPVLKPVFGPVLDGLERYQQRIVASAASFGVALSGSATLFKGELNVLPPVKSAAGDTSEDPQPEQEKAAERKAFLNLEATASAGASASAQYDLEERPREKTRTHTLTFEGAYNYGLEFGATLAAWQQDLETLKEAGKISEEAADAGKEELGKLEQKLKEALEAICAPDCDTSFSGGFFFGVRGKDVEGVFGFQPEAILIGFKSPKPIVTANAEKANAYTLTYTIQASRFADRNEFDALLARLASKLKGVQQALSDEQRRKANELIAALQAAGEGNLQPIADAGTAPPAPFDAQKLFSEFMGALAQVIDKGEFEEEIEKVTKNELEIGGKLGALGARLEMEIKPLSFTRSTKYPKTRGRLLAGRQYALEDYSAVEIGTFDAQEYFTKVLEDYFTGVYNDVLAAISQGVTDGIEGAKRVIKNVRANLTLERANQVKNAVLSWWNGETKPASPEAAPAPYRPLDPEAIAGKPRYGIGGFHLFNAPGETPDLAEPAALVLSYEDEALGGWPESDLAMFRWNENAGDWERVVADHDLDANTLSAAIERLGLYTIGTTMPAGFFEWTVTGVTRTGSGANLRTEVSVESTPIRLNTGAIVPPGTVVHVQSIDELSLSRFAATPLGDLTSPDAQPDVPGPQRLVDADGRVRVSFSLPGTPAKLHLRAFTDAGTADGTASVVLPVQP